MTDIVANRHGGSIDGASEIDKCGAFTIALPVCLTPGGAKGASVNLQNTGGRFR